MKKLFVLLVLFGGIIISAPAFAVDFDGSEDSSTLDNEDAADYQGQGQGGVYANS